MGKAHTQGQVGPNSSSNSSASKQPPSLSLSSFIYKIGAKVTYAKELSGRRISGRMD